MSLVLTERQSQEIETYCHIARENGAAISLSELIELISIEASEGELGDALLSDPRLMSNFMLESGYVVARGPPRFDGETLMLVKEQRRNKERAMANLETANAFGRLLVGGAVLVSVSGANSYLSAREGDDIDFFCVTRTHGLWKFMLRALLLARIYRTAHSEVPELCFSCVMSESWAKDAFREQRQPIFARDALTAKIISGARAYHSFLKEAHWMRGYFPSFYGMRMREANSGAEHPSPGGGQKSGSAVVNSFLYHTLGSFLRAKSWALNRRLAKAGKTSSIFMARIGMQYYINESNRYRKLRGMYREFGMNG